MEYQIIDSIATPLQKQLEVTLSAEEAAAKVEEIYAFLAVQAGIDYIADQGAKPFEQRYGDDLKEKVAQCLANQCADDVILAEGLPAALEPVVKSISGMGGQPFSCTILLYLNPQEELSSYDPVTLSIPPFEVTDEQVERNMRAVVEKRSSFVDDDEATCADDDAACVITLATTKAGMPVEALCADGLIYRISDGRFPDQINDQLRGMEPGQTKTFSFVITSKNFLGMDVPETMDAELTLHKMVRRDVPEVTDAWVHENIPGASTVEGFRAMIRDNVTMRGRADYDKLRSEAALGALTQRLPEMDLPEVYTEYARAGLLQNFSTALSRQGMSQEEFYNAQGVTSTQFMIQMSNRARDVLRQGLALDALARHEGMQVTEEDLKTSLKAMAPSGVDEARKMLTMNGRLYQLHEMAMRAKARAHLLDHAETEPVE